MDVFVAGEVPDAIIDALGDRQQVAVEGDVAAALDRVPVIDPACVVLGELPVSSRTVVRRIRTHTNAPVVVLVGDAAERAEADLSPNVSVAPASDPARAASRVTDAIADGELDRLQRRHRQVRSAVEAVKTTLETVRTRTDLDRALATIGDSPAYHAAWVLRPPRGEKSDTLHPAAATGVPQSTLAAVAVGDERAPARAFREGGVATDPAGNLTTVALPVGDGVLVVVAPVAAVPPGEREALAGLASVATSALAPDTDGLTVLGDTLAHELVNHLELAGTYLELAEEHGEPTDFAQVLDALERIRQVADDARALARDEPELEPVDLATVAESAWVESGDAALSVEDGALRADRGLLELCFENLFRNARQYGGEDVTVTVAPFETGFVVSDDGPGIPPERRDDVLEWGEGEGSGVGLGIVALVAERHGWSVEVRESEAGGAAFRFS